MQPTARCVCRRIVAASPHGLAGPRGLPAPIVQLRHGAFTVAAFDPAHGAELARHDQDLTYLEPEDHGRAMRDACAAEKRTVERLGLARGTP